MRRKKNADIKDNVIFNVGDKILLKIWKQISIKLTRVSSTGSLQRLRRKVENISPNFEKPTIQPGKVHSVTSDGTASYIIVLKANIAF